MGIGEQEGPVEAESLQIVGGSFELVGEGAGLESVQHGMGARVGTDGDAASRERTQPIRVGQPQLRSSDGRVPFVRTSELGGDRKRNSGSLPLHEEIESDVDGVVAEIHPKNGQPIEFGEPLFSVRPD